MAKTREAQIARLKEILAVPTFFRKEHDLLRYLIKFLRTTPYVYDLDEFGNIYITKGESDVYPLVCAHTDSVQGYKKIRIEEVPYKDKLRLIGKNPDTDAQCGMGADDKAGVFVCLELLDIMPTLKVALFAGEEFGCVGSHNAREEFFENVGYVIEFDCPSNSDITHYCNGVELFDLDGVFYSQIVNILYEQMPNTPRLFKHPYTDVWAIKRRIPISCINLATGYYRYHTDGEYVVVDDVLNAIKMGETIINTLGNQMFEHKTPLRESMNYETTASKMRAAYPNVFTDEEKTLRDSYINLLYE